MNNYIFVIIILFIICLSLYYLSKPNVKNENIEKPNTEININKETPQMEDLDITEGIDKSKEISKNKDIIQSKTWKDQLEKLSNGIFYYPSNIKKRFIYETSIFTDFDSKFIEKFIESDELESIEHQDYTPFAEHINLHLEVNLSNSNVISFENKSKDTLLIIPIPKPDKNYLSIKDFIDNAPKQQQYEFWNYASEQILKFKKKYGQIYVSTHGLGVYYFHLRLCTKPKYYISDLK